MKNFKAIFIIILFLSFTFIGKTYYESKQERLTFSNLIPLNNRINERLIENFFSNDETQRIAARKQLKKIVLTDLNYDNWIEYSDYIEILIFPMDISGDANKELLIALNISKDLGVIGIYNKHNEFYSLNSVIDNLTTINNITAIKDSNKKNIFIIVEQMLDESMGAYFVDNYIQIFSLHDMSLSEVFRYSLDYNALYYEKWINPTLENPKWFKITEKNIIDHISNEDDNIVLFISKTLSKYEGNLTNNDEIPTTFKLVEQKSFDVKYTWDNKFNSFLLGYGKIISSNRNVGILEDTSQTVDYLLNLTGKYYKVIDEEHNISYIEEDDLITY